MAVAPVEVPVVGQVAARVGRVAPVAEVDPE
jgi:hypothetical protein